MQEWIWNQFGLQIPDDWEMLQFSKDPSKGNCAFADRQRFRLEMNWRCFDDWPDFERMIGDYQSKLTDEQGMSEFKNLSHGAWTGFHCLSEAGWTTRMGRFFEGTSKLIEMVFLWENDVVVSEVKEILSSFVLHLPKEGLQRWRAFGMDFLVDAEYVLSECRVQPALASMTFVDREQRPTRTDVFERYGLIEEWLKCDLSSWLVIKRPKRISDCSLNNKSHARHKLTLETGKSPALNFPKFNWKKNRYDGTAWICPEDNRLYHVSRVFPADETTRGGMNRVLLSCCDAMALNGKI